MKLYVWVAMAARDLRWKLGKLGRVGQVTRDNVR